MFYRIDVDEEREQLDTKVNRWIIDAESEHRQMYEEWNEADAYFENDQVPIGFSERHADALANAQNPTQGTVTSKQYVVYNQVVSSHERLLGDFINAKRMIVARGRSPKDRKFANAWRAELEYIQDANMFWEKCIVPSISAGIRRGLHWLKVYFDPTRNLPWGKIVIDELSCRDVLVHADARKIFFSDATMLAHRMRFPTEVADKKFRANLEVIGARTFGTDKEYDDAYTSTRSGIENYTTIYEIHYTEVETKYQLVNGEELIDIDEGQAETAFSIPELAKRVIVSTIDQQYVCLYSRSTGVFYNDVNKYGIRLLIPVINIHSEGRLYPFGSQKYENRLQDLINVFLTVMLDNAKRGNKGIIGVDPGSYQAFQDEITQAINSPGTRAIPANNLTVSYPRELSQAFVTLFQIVQQGMEQVQSQHSLSKGEMPKERLAHDTVNLLLAQDRLSHGRKDVMIQWAMTEVARAIYHLVREHYQMAHFARLNNVKEGEADFTPINYVLTEDEYHQLLLTMMGISLDGKPTPEEQVQLEEAVAQFQAKFNAENEVKIEIENGYIIGGEKYNEDQFQDMVKKSGRTSAEFIQTFQVEIKQARIYRINDITRDADLDLIYSIDFNAERDKQYKENRALLLFDRGILTGNRVLKDLEYPDSESAWAEAQQANQIAQVGELVVGNPEIYEKVMAMAKEAQSAKTSGGSKNGEKKKEPANA